MVPRGLGLDSPVTSPLRGKKLMLTCGDDRNHDLTHGGWVTFTPSRDIYPPSREGMSEIARAANVTFFGASALVFPEGVGEGDTGTPNARALSDGSSTDGMFKTKATLVEICNRKGIVQLEKL